MGLIVPAGAGAGGAGPQGPQGFQGLQGAQGAAGAGGTDTWPKLMPTSVLAESAWRGDCTSNNGGPGSGSLKLTSVWLPAGLVIGHLGMFTSNPGATAPTHSWAGLFDSARVLLAETADAGAAAIGATSLLSYAIAQIASGAAATFTTTYTGLHYVGWMFAATTTPNCYGPPSQGFGAGPLTTAPTLTGDSNTGMTTPPAFPFTANPLTGSTVPMYVNVAS